MASKDSTHWDVTAQALADLLVKKGLLSAAQLHEAISLRQSSALEAAVPLAGVIAEASVHHYLITWLYLATARSDRGYVPPSRSTSLLIFPVCFVAAGAASSPRTA